jgi:hypothetical protein
MTAPSDPCVHDAVDESLVQHRRRFKSYRELCLDCGASRCREPKRFTMGRWSPWAKGGHCCLGLTDDECAYVPLRQCEGWQADA